MSVNYNNPYNNYVKVLNKKYYLGYSNYTEVQVENKYDQEIIIIGLCIDSHGEIEKKQIAKEMLENSNNSINKLYKYSNRFAGKYVVIYSLIEKKDNKYHTYIFGDATVSMQINYAFIDDNLVLSSIDNLIASHNNLKQSSYSKKIRDASDYLQALPNNLTMFDEIKALLPNHYLDVNNKIPIRVPIYNECNNIDSMAVISKTISLVNNIVKEYSNYYNLVCPLSGGLDSRMNLSFLYRNVESFNCYTFSHNWLNDDSEDIRIPKLICKQLKIKHILIPELNISQKELSTIKYLIGDYHSNLTIQLAYMYKSFFSNEAMINGDIAGQVGKSSLSRNIPYFLANPSFFCCKIHNYEQLCKNEFKNYINNIKEVNDIKLIHDLFAIESRCSRWSSQREMIYSVCGINSLNIYNCREVILMWCSLSRRLRMNKYIHTQIISKQLPQIEDITIDKHPNYNLQSFIKSHWILFYIGVYLKHWLKL